MCKISDELVGGLESNLHGYNIGFIVTTEVNRLNLCMGGVVWCGDICFL